ncbi:MAG: winged helix-turn-helix transcriptional regulator [Rhodospirillaceae bacterium]|nr:winged helix-turn-helix transcriptional regulator [Rhodospirillaceae bacterium]
MVSNPGTIIEVCLALHLRRATRRLTRLYDKALAPYGLDTSQFNLLSVIAALEAAPLTTVAEILDVDPSTLSRTLKPLKAQNLLQIKGGRGRGGLTIKLTLQGNDTYNAASTAWKSAQGQTTAIIGETQVGRLLDLLDNLAFSGRQPVE